MRRLFAISRQLIALGAILAIVSADAWACPGCKEALASSDGGDLVGGFFWSILFMMGMPFAIFGTFAGSMYVAVRRARTSSGAPQSRPKQTERDLVGV